MILNYLITITFLGPSEKKLSPIVIRESGFMGCFDPNPDYEVSPFDRVELKECIASALNGTITFDYSMDILQAELKCHITDKEKIYILRLYFQTDSLPSYKDLSDK